MDPLSKRRGTIDQIDRDLVNLLSRRMEAVKEIGEQNQAYLKGLPEVARVEEILARLDDDDEARAILKAQLKVRKLVPDKVKKKDRAKLIKSLRKVASQHPGTAAERDADRAIERLRSG